MSLDPIEATLDDILDIRYANNPLSDTDSTEIYEYLSLDSYNTCDESNAILLTNDPSQGGK